MPLLDVIESAARLRMSEDERITQDAFRRDVARHWTPVAAPDRRLERRSRWSHLAVALFGGPITLASVAVSGVVTTVGSALLVAAPVPASTNYGSEVPTWLGVVLTLGIIGMAYQCGRSPHAIRARPFVAVGVVPLAVGSLGSAWTMRITLPPDQVLRAALVLVGLGTAYAGIAACAGRRRHARGGLAAVGVGALGVCGSDGSWVALFAYHHFPVQAFGCALSAAGSLLMANGLLFAHPDVRAS